MGEHVPNPHPPEGWSEEDMKKYIVFANDCPMCAYKMMYAQIQRLMESIDAAGIQEGPAYESLTMQLAMMQKQLVELGLFIASTVDEQKAVEKARLFN